jgi:simple sugar transport system permease protein
LQGRRWLRIASYNGVAIALGVALGLVVVAIAGGNVVQALKSFFISPISTSTNVGEVLVRFVALYTIGLGIGLALKAGLWNVGGEGQFIIGEVMAFVGVIYIGGIPAPLHVFVILLLGTAGGLVWIVVPTVLRAKFGANEIVITLLFNIVATFVGYYALNGPIQGKTQSFGFLLTDLIPSSLALPALIPGTRLTIALFITLGIAIAMYLLVERTAFGLRVSTVGESTETARYAGINVTRVFVLVMLVAGALAGLAGAMHATGVLGFLDTAELQPGFGYLAIIVALLGRKNMLGIGLASLLFGYVIVGAQDMAQAIPAQSGMVYAMEGAMLIGVSLASYLLTRRQSL